MLQYDYAGDALDDFRVFFGEPWDPARMALFGPLPGAATDTTFTGFMSEGDIDWINGAVSKLRFDFGRLAGKTINVSNFFLREPTNAEANSFDPPTVVETVCIELDTSRVSPNDQLQATESGTDPIEYQLTTVGPDPWIRTKPITELYDIDSSYIIEFEYKASASYNELMIFFGPPISAGNSFVTSPVPAAEEWTTYTINPRVFTDNFQNQNWTDFRIDFGRGEDPTVQKTFDLRNLKIRKPTAQELIEEQNSDRLLSRAINLQFNQYRTRNYADAVSAVAVDTAEVTITGTVSGSGPYFLAEVDPQDYGFNLDTYENLIPLTVTDGQFSVTQPRFVPLADRNKDRLYARWTIVTDDGDGSYTKTAPLAWATDIVRVAASNLPEDKAATIKGLDGLTSATIGNFDDLIDLDIRSMKINLLLHGTLTLTPNGTGATHEFNGKTYYVNQNFVDRLDASIRSCTENDIKPAVVLLIPIAFGNPVLDSIWTHPDASLGLYSMANVADARGVEYYTAAIDYLARRYSRPDSLYGRLDQWIIHNEVDAHTSWTHAGQKPAPLYTQIYDRSMRLVHFTLRKYNPTAKVFTSFTKHFASKVGGENGPNFRSKEILNTLNTLMKLEGDYEWGIGWHSYPTNLRNPAVWNDAISATPLSYNAAQITPRNLEVIDAYVRQESVLYNGKKVRTILLSENGFSSNTNDNPTFTQERQAAAVAYFWKKTDQRLPAVENIQYHRWVDNPNEGNLEFGLWTVEPGTVQGFGEKKESWYVWEAAGTVEEDDVFAPYLSTIGISDWSEIMFDFPTETTPYRVGMTIANCDADLTDVLVSFNGEHKFPQADGTVTFYNVASNVDQPLVIRKGDVILQSDVLVVGEDLELNFDLGTVSGLTATGISPTEIELNWMGGAAGASFTIERSDNGSSFTSLAEVTDTTYVDASVVSGRDYAYRVALLLDEEGTTGCFSEEATITAPDLIVEYRNGDRNRPANNKVAPELRLVNVSDVPVGIDDITVRYWFTAENVAPLNFFVDYAALGTNDVSGSFTQLPTPREGADHYLEVSFDTDYQVPANGNSGDIKTRIAKANWTNFDEADDYSYADVRNYVSTDRITVYRNGTLIWGREPAAVPPVTALLVEHRNPDAPANNSIKPELNLVNTGNVPVDLADVTIRYWFTPEGTATVNYALDYAVLGANNITGNFADGYFEVGFDPSLGQLGAASETGEMKFRLFKSDWSNFDETDDHSWVARNNAPVANDRITAYLDGQLIWGTEPPVTRELRSPAVAAPAALDAPLADQLTLYPNPTTGSVWLDLPAGFEATALYLLDATGRSFTLRLPTDTGRLDLGRRAPGVYLLRAVAADGTTIVGKALLR